MAGGLPLGQAVAGSVWTTRVMGTGSMRHRSDPSGNNA